MEKEQWPLLPLQAQICEDIFDHWQPQCYQSSCQMPSFWGEVASPISPMVSWGSPPFKLCCTLPGVHYLECFILVVSIIFTEQFMFSLSFLKNWLLEFTKVLQSMEPKDKNLHKTTKIPSFFFCIPVFHSSFLYLTYPTIFCNFFTLSACRVKTKN